MNESKVRERDNSRTENEKNRIETLNRKVVIKKKKKKSTCNEVISTCNKQCLRTNNMIDLQQHK